MRSDQVEEAWDVVTTIQEAWENDKSLSLDKYEAGSWGPEASDELLARRDMRGYQTRITRKKRKRKKRKKLEQEQEEVADGKYIQ
jgi:glucose-6-phosphate 1-dehydrogenase